MVSKSTRLRLALAASGAMALIGVPGGCFNPQPEPPAFSEDDDVEAGGPADDFGNPAPGTDTNTTSPPGAGGGDAGEGGADPSDPGGGGQGGAGGDLLE